MKWKRYKLYFLCAPILCLSLVASGQKTADGVFLAGQEAMARGNHEMALQQFNAAIALYVQMEMRASANHQTLPTLTLQRYAFALAAVGKLDDAVVHLKAASAAAPKNATLHDNLGSLYAQQQKWSDAQSEFAEASRLVPLDAVKHLHLGLAMQAQGEPNATKEIEKAAVLAPENESIALQYGIALEGIGNDAKAILVLQHLLVRHPADVAALYELGLALQRTDRVSEAVSLFERVLRLQPQNADALTNLGVALTQEQRAKDAVPVLQKAVTMAPNNPTSMEDLAAAYLQLNQLDDAMAQLQLAEKLEPEAAQIHYDLGLTYKMQDDVEHAIPELQQAERLDANEPEAPLALGMLYMQTGRYADAAREIKSSLDMRPQNGDAWATLGSVYNHLDELSEAEAALRQAIAQQPDQADSHLTLAEVFMKEKKIPDAIAERHEAAQLMREHMNVQRAEVAVHTGETLLKAGDLMGAMVQFQDALTYDPSDSEAHDGLAKVYDAQGRHADAAAERMRISPKR